MCPQESARRSGAGNGGEQEADACQRTEEAQQLRCDNEGADRDYGL
jgi:hypothetical protein